MFKFSNYRFKISETPTLQFHQAFIEPRSDVLCILLEYCSGGTFPKVMLNSFLLDNFFDDCLHVETMAGDLHSMLSKRSDHLEEETILSYFTQLCLALKVCERSDCLDSLVNHE
jgi:serine/threonine protein kinase